MNARQKAKHYKKALEAYNRLVDPPKEVHVDQTQLKHYMMSVKVDADDIFKDPNAATNAVRNIIVQQCVPIVYNNIRQTEKPMNNFFIYECDIWAKN